MRKPGLVGLGRGWGRVFLWALVAWTLMGPPGCADASQLADATRQAQGWQEQWARRLEEREAMLASTPASDPARAELEEQIRRSRTVLEALEAGIAQVRSATQGARAGNNPSDEIDSGENVVGTIAGAVAGVVPGAWQVPVILAGGLAAAVLRARKLKLGLASIVKSIELAKREDGAFRERFQSNSNLLRTIQTPLAQRIVDEVSRGRVIASPI